MSDLPTSWQTRRYALPEEAPPEPSLHDTPHPSEPASGANALINHIVSQIQQPKDKLKDEPVASRPHSVSHPTTSTATSIHHSPTSSATSTTHSSSSSSNPLLGIGLAIGALLLFAIITAAYFLYIRPYYRGRKATRNANNDNHRSRSHKPAQLSNGAIIQSTATPAFHAAPAAAQRRARSTVLRLMDEGMWKVKGRCPRSAGRDGAANVDLEHGCVPEDPAHWNARVSPRRDERPAVDGVIPIGYDYSGYDYALRNPRSSGTEAAHSSSGVSAGSKDSGLDREIFSTVSPVSECSDDMCRRTLSPVSPIALPESVYQMPRRGGADMPAGFV